MKTNEKLPTEQLLDEIEVKQPTTVEKKPQKASTSYALKAVAGHLKTLKEAKLLEEKDEATISEIVGKAVAKYITKEFGI